MQEKLFPIALLSGTGNPLSMAGLILLLSAGTARAAGKEGSSVEKTFFDLAVSDKGTVFLSHLALGINSANGVAEYTEQASAKVFRSLNGGKSFDNFVLDDSVCVCCHTKAVASPAGEAYFSWRSLDKSTAKPVSSTYSAESGRQDDTARDPVVARTLDGGIGNAYSKPRRIPDKGWFINGCPSSGTGIDIDNRGRIHAAYFTGSGEAGEGIGYYLPTPMTRALLSREYRS